jgi:D-inositol-3-phosphate glycosyltransferase
VNSVRRRLALVVPNMTAGGGVQSVGRFLANVAKRAEAFDLRLISLSESSRDPASLRLTSPASWVKGHTAAHGNLEGVPYAHVGAVGGELEFQRYRSRPALTRSLADCDVIQVVCGSPAWANALTGLGKPVSMHVATRAIVERRQRDAQSKTPADKWRKAMTKVTNRLDDRALRAVDAIQVMNPWMLEYARALNVDRQIDVRLLPPGVDAATFRPAPSGKPSADRFVLCVARLNDPRKNITLLVEAFALLPDRIRETTRIVVAGSPPPTASFHDRVRELGLQDRVEVVENPTASALLKLYQDARVFALPSDEEGFGMVLLEAMACGTPVVSTLSGGPDAIITNDEDGYLVPRHDAAALADRLARLLENEALAAQMGARARRTIEQRYDEKIVGEAFVEIWQRLRRA